MMAPLGGGNPTTLATSPVTNPQRIAVDSTYVYWVATGGFGSCAIYKVPIAGGNPVGVAGSDDFGAIAANGSGFFYVEMGQVANAGSVRQITGGNTTILASGLSYPTGMAVDATDVFWINAGNGGGGTLVKAPIGGGSVTGLSIAYANAGKSLTPTVATDATSVYWHDAQYGDIIKMSPK
jgi:hypothetical protein